MATWLRCFLALSIPCAAAMAGGQPDAGQRAVAGAGSISLVRVVEPPVPTPAPELAAWRQAAERGEVDAQTQLASAYYLGQGVAPDYHEALTWYRKAAEQGDRKAQTVLGLMHEGGEGVPKDAREAARWFRLAAERGDVDAQSRLGEKCYLGEGVPKDLDEAKKWFKLAALQGFHQELEVLRMEQGDESLLRLLCCQLRNVA